MFSLSIIQTGRLLWRLTCLFAHKSSNNFCFVCQYLNYAASFYLFVENYLKLQHVPSGPPWYTTGVWEPQASVFYISRVFSIVRSVLSQCNTRLRLLHLLYDIAIMWHKNNKTHFSIFCTLMKHGFWPIRACADPIYIIT